MNKIILTMVALFSITAHAGNESNINRYGTYSFLSLDVRNAQNADDIKVYQLVVSEDGVKINFSDSETETYPSTLVLRGAQNSNVDQHIFQYLQTPDADVIWLMKSSDNSRPEMFIDFSFSNPKFDNVAALLVILDGPFGPMPIGFILKSNSELDVLKTVIAIKN